MKDPNHISHLSKTEKQTHRVAFNLMFLGFAFYFFPMLIDRIVMIRYIPLSMVDSIKNHFQLFHFVVAFCVITLTGLSQMAENPKYKNQFNLLKNSYRPGFFFAMASSLYIFALALTSKAIMSH